MSKTPPGMRAVYALVREETWERFAAVMDSTGRGVAEELEHAMARHADQPPQVVTPPLEPVTVERADGRPKRGRPRK